MIESTDFTGDIKPKSMKMIGEKEISYSSSMAIINKLNALKQNISGGGSHDKPAELFRKDLISAMKLADSEALKREDYCLISDHWRQDWEKGVQVPVNANALKRCQVNYLKENVKLFGPYLCKLPKKLLHAVADETYRQGMHELHDTQKLADEVCRYDLDELDVTWLSNYNCLRLQQGDTALSEYEVERVMEALETRCYDGMQEAMKSVGLVGIEYDENVVCDVCRSPESEDDNEMIFCDACDVCVHQACYGVHKIPSGSWLCRPCALGIKPRCILCPNAGGAMKSTHDGSQWAHLSCSLWIPEIAIMDTEKMEPIDKLNEIPANRWTLICTLCRERTGACIQCSVKKCKTAFHVTCAFQDDLEMKTNFNESSELILKAYCTKHSRKRDSIDGSPKKNLTCTPKKHSEMTEEEKKAEKNGKLQKLAEEFYTYVGDLKQLSEVMELDEETVDIIYSYWFLKRKSNFNRPLMTPKVEEGDVLLKQREDGMIARLKMFLHLRQDLERVRNLCYMVSRREKLRNQHLEAKRNIFMQQAAIVRSQVGRSLGARDYKSLITAHLQSTSIYDRPDDVLRVAQIELPAFPVFTDANPVSTQATTDVEDDCEILPKVSKVAGRGRGRPPGGLSSKKATVTAPVRPKLTPASAENPYARPTYKSFSWIISSRRQSLDTAASTSTPTTTLELGCRKRRREICGETPNSSAADSFTDQKVTSLPTPVDYGTSDHKGTISDVETNSNSRRCKRMRLENERLTISGESVTVVVKEDSALSSVIDIGTDEKVLVDTSNAAAVPLSITPGDSLSELNEGALNAVTKEHGTANIVVEQSPESVDIDVLTPCHDLAGNLALCRELLAAENISNPSSVLFDSPNRKEKPTPESLRKKNGACLDTSRLQTRHFSDVLLSKSPASVMDKPVDNWDSVALTLATDGVKSPSKTSMTVRNKCSLEATVNGATRTKLKERFVGSSKRGGIKKQGSDRFLQKTLDSFVYNQASAAVDGLVNGHVSASSVPLANRVDSLKDNIKNAKLHRHLSMRPARKRLIMSGAKPSSIRSGDSDSCDTLLVSDGESFVADDVSNSSWNRRSSLRSSMAVIS